MVSVKSINDLLGRKSFCFLIIIFILATVLRFIPVMYLEYKSPGWHDHNINEIEFYYDDVARSLIAGKGFVHSVNPRTDSAKYRFPPGTPFCFVPPLYAWLLYVIYSVFGPNVFVAKLIQSLLDSAVIFLLYLLGKRIFADRRIGILAALLYAIYPLAIVMCTRLYYQIPMNLALCLLILSLMSVPTILNGIWTGIALGAATLAKPVTLPLVAIMPIVRIVKAYYYKQAIMQTINWVFFFLVAVVLTLTPWTIRNYIVFKEFVPVQKGAGSPLLQGSKEEYLDLDVYELRNKYGFNFGVDPKDFTKIAVKNHIDHLESAPLDYMRFLGKKFLLTWYNTEGKAKNKLVLLIQIPFLTFALISLISSIRLWLTKSNWYIPSMILFICVIQVAFFPLVRYTLVVMPLVMLMSAHGIYLTWIRLTIKNDPILT